MPPKKPTAKDRPSSGRAGAFTPDPILRPRQQVENQLRQAILAGTLRQGDRLPSETQLAGDLSVSRATVREALRSLAENGLITKTPGARGGSFVEYIDHHSFADMMSDRLKSTIELGSISYEEVAALRDMLEIPSARLAATNRTDEDLTALWAIVDREKAIASDDPEVRDLNMDFHAILARASGNRALEASVIALHRASHPIEFIAATPEVGRESVVQHIEIVSAVRDGKATAAATAMQRHLAYLDQHARTS